MLKQGLMSVVEAAEFLGISKHTLNVWKSQRRIPFIKLGRRTVFDPVELVNWIAGHRVQPREAT